MKNNIRPSYLSIAFSFLVSSALGSFAQSNILDFHIPDKYQQVVLVTTDNWSSSKGKVAFFEKIDSRWVAYDSSINVNVGKNGLGWGLGLHQTSSLEPEKIEGDGKAPAGVFEFGVSFGYSDTPPVGSSWKYQSVDSRDYFVDDPDSQDYNKWVRLTEDKANEPKAYWKSFERMKRLDHLYELGILINHNNSPIVPKKGSAIFLHIWRTEFSPTLGCTAMSKENITRLLRWLDPLKNPILIQIPKDQLSNIEF